MRRGSHPLALAIGKRLEIVRETRKVSQDEAAKILGITAKHYVLLERGYVIPTQWLARRILRWWFENKSFEGHATPDSYTKRAVKAGYVKLNCAIPMSIRNAARRRAEGLGITLGEYVIMALQQLNNGEGIYKLYATIKEEIHKTEIAGYLSEVPEIQHILESDLKIVTKLTGQPQPAAEGEELFDVIKAAHVPTEALKADYTHLINDWKKIV